MFRSARLLALACVPAMLLSVHSAEAAARRARLTVTVSVEGTEGVVGIGSDRTSAKFREGFTLVTYLETDGELAQFDTKDPEYAQKMMGLSQNVHKTVRAAQGKAPVKKMTQEQIQEYVRNKQAACGANQACLMQLAQEAQDLMMNMDTGALPTAPRGIYRRRTAALPQLFRLRQLRRERSRLRGSHHPGHGRRHQRGGAIHRPRHRRLSQQRDRNPPHLQLEHPGGRFRDGSFVATALHSYRRRGVRR
jgi:hypothetical protein